MYSEQKGRATGERYGGARVKVTELLKDGSADTQHVYLHVQKAVLEDEGVYQCVASNHMGYDIKTTHFKVNQSK